MKAAIYTNYGPPEVVKIKEIEKPIPADNEVLIKVHASTVNRTDCGFRSAEYFISRFWSGLLRPKYQTLGCEFAGEIQQVGKAVTEFKTGDKVFGFNDEKFGGHAEYLTLPATAAITFIPENISFNEAAAIGEGAHYALCNIRAAKVQAGQNVLLYGSTGAIGSAALQLLKQFGARVTAVCDTRNVELVKSLGADEVIDYQTQDFTQTEQRFDVIFDAVGKSSIGACKKVMKEKSLYMSTELGKNGQNVWLALVAPLMGGKKVLFPIPVTKKEDFELLADLVSSKKFKPIIDRVYPLDDIVEAYKYVETGQKTGNVIIKIA